jgi:DNA-binding NtrC family response regulator
MVEEISQRTAMLLESADASPEEARKKAQSLRMALEEFEKQFIIDTLNQNRGHRTKTAAMLGIDRKTLYTKMKKYGMA